jgi:tRNA 2-thiouridine synthesizing protein A
LRDNGGLFPEYPMSLQPDAILDATGLNCPEPVMMLHNKVRDLQAGGLLKVIATDPSTRRDIPKFCMFLDHQLVEQSEEGGTYLYWIRKKAE